MSRNKGFLELINSMSKSRPQRTGPFLSPFLTERPSTQFRVCESCNATTSRGAVCEYCGRPEREGRAEIVDRLMGKNTKRSGLPEPSNTTYR